MQKILYTYRNSVIQRVILFLARKDPQQREMPLCAILVTRVYGSSFHIKNSARVSSLPNSQPGSKPPLGYNQRWYYRSYIRSGSTPSPLPTS